MKRIALALIFVAMTAGVGLAQQGVPPEKFRITDILITSYRGPSVADTSAYFSSKAGKDFERELQSDDDERYCLQAPQLEKATGLWQGTVEPSYWIHANARPTEAEAYAAEHAKKHQQDAVLVFESEPDGPDAEYVFTWPQAPAIGVVFDALKKAGFDGGTIAGNKLLIVDPKAANKAKAATLAEALGVHMQTNTGRAHMFDQAGYQKVLALYDAFPHSCPTQH